MNKRQRKKSVKRWFYNDFADPALNGVLMKWQAKVPLHVTGKPLDRLWRFNWHHATAAQRMDLLFQRVYTPHVSDIIPASSIIKTYSFVGSPCPLPVVLP